MDESAINKMNISVSGWPGSGSTTLALILAHCFNRKYIYIGNIYRYLGSKMGFSDKGINRPQFDEYIEDVVGKTIDLYSDFVLLNEDNLILDSDISVFRLGRHPKVFSIFLTTPLDQRKARLVENKLEMEFLDERDTVLRAQYQQLWGIDYFDTELINQKHNLVLDNSNMGLELELKEVFKALKSWGPFSDLLSSRWEELEIRSQEIIKIFREQGKKVLLKQLQEKEMFPDPQTLLYEITSLFPEEVSSFPDHIKKFFLPT